MSTFQGTQVPFSTKDGGTRPCLHLCTGRTVHARSVSNQLASKARCLARPRVNAQLQHILRDPLEHVRLQSVIHTRYVEFLLPPVDLQATPFHQLAPSFQVMSSDDSLLSASVPQDFAGHDGHADPARAEEVRMCRNDLRESSETTLFLSWSFLKAFLWPSGPSHSVFHIRFTTSDAQRLTCSSWVRTQTQSFVVHFPFGKQPRAFCTSFNPLLTPR